MARAMANRDCCASGSFCLPRAEKNFSRAPSGLENLEKIDDRDPREACGGRAPGGGGEGDGGSDVVGYGRSACPGSVAEYGCPHCWAGSSVVFCCGLTTGGVTGLPGCPCCNGGVIG